MKEPCYTSRIVTVRHTFADGTVHFRKGCAYCRSFDSACVPKASVTAEDLAEAFDKSSNNDARDAECPDIIEAREARIAELRAFRSLPADEQAAAYEVGRVSRYEDPSWRPLREEVLRRAGAKPPFVFAVCQIGVIRAGLECGRAACEAHHLHYNTFWNESPEDLVALCAECHHAETKYTRRNGSSPRIVGL